MKEESGVTHAHEVIVSQEFSPHPPVWARRLKAERLERCWSQKDMVRRLTEVARGYADLRLPTRESLARMLRDWESGRTRPRAPYPRLLAQVFEVAEADIFAAQDSSSRLSKSRILTISSNERIPVQLSHSDTDASLGGLLAALADFTAGDFDRERTLLGTFIWDALDGGEMDRRTAMQLFALLGTGTLTSSNAVDMLLSPVDRAIGDREGFDADDWKRVAWEYSFRTNTGPLGALVGDLMADITEVGRLLGRTTLSSVRDDLLWVTASMAQTLSGEFTHIRATSEARRSQRTARRAADASRDRDLRVSVRAGEAWNLFAAGGPTHVILHLLDDAVRISDGVSSAALARAYAARATVLASRSAAYGDGKEKARTALRDLQSTFERLPDSSTQDDLTYWGFSERALRFTEAEVLSLLGDTGEATQAVERACDLYAPALVHGIANLRLIRSHSLICERDVPEGLDYALASVQGLPTTPYRRRILGQIVDALPEKARALPAARELRALASGQSAGGQGV